MRSLCVYCGSNKGNRPEFQEAAETVGRLLAESGIRLIYGGGNVGLMGVVADSVLAAGGEVVGVIPGHLMERELGHTGLTELHVVADMHERKAKMIGLADGFVALPGSIGTLEETIEAMTWGQLGLHPKPCALLNVLGYYDALVAQLETFVAHGFLPREHLGLLYVETDPVALIGRLRAHEPVLTDKWLARRKFDGRD